MVNSSDIHLLTSLPRPAGGCLLTDKNFCNRFSDLLEHCDKKDYTRDDLTLLKIGRHLRINNNKIIIGRNKAENNILEQYSNKFITMRAISHPGPITLVEDENMVSPLQKQCARITARFSKGRNQNQVKIQIAHPDGASEITTIAPMLPDKINQEWYI